MANCLVHASRACFFMSCEQKINNLRQNFRRLPVFSGNFYNNIQSDLAWVENSCHNPKDFQRPEIAQETREGILKRTGEELSALEKNFQYQINVKS